MTKKPRPLIDAVVANLPRSTGRGRWIETLSAEDVAELREIFGNWSAGLVRDNRTGKPVSRTSLSVAIAKAFAERGRPVHEHTVSRWLDSL